MPITSTAGLVLLLTIAAAATVLSGIACVLQVRSKLREIRGGTSEPRPLWEHAAIVSMASLAFWWMAQDDPLLLRCYWVLFPILWALFGILAIARGVCWWMGRR